MNFRISLVSCIFDDVVIVMFFVYKLTHVLAPGEDIS